jgi:hypothetical protein
MHRPKPFARFHAFMEAVAAVNQMTGIAKELGLQDLGTYKSRGKGKHRSKIGKVYRATNKFIPHQGKQEIARRLRQQHKLELRKAA